MEISGSGDIRNNSIVRQFPFFSMAAKFWNALPNKLRALLTVHDFILAIRQYTLIN